MRLIRLAAALVILALVVADLSAQAPPAPAPLSAGQLADEAIRLTASNRPVEAQSLFERALSLAAERGETIVEGRAHWGLGRLAYVRGDHAAAEAYYARAIDLLTVANAGELLAALMWQRGGELADRADYAGAERHWRRGIEVVRTTGPRWFHGQLLRSLSFLPTLAITERLASIEEAERLVAGQGRVALEGLVAHQHGDLAFVAGDYARALAATERAASLFERAGARADLARALTSIGRIYRVHGQPEQAVPFYARALDVQQALNQGAGAVQSLLGLAIANVVIGNAADAEAAYARAVDVARTSAPSDVRFALAQQAIGLAGLGRVADAERAIAEATSLPKGPRDDATIDGAAGIVHFAAGRHALAVEQFDRALASEGGLPMDARVEVLDRRAQALDALGRSAEALAAADAAIEGLERLRASLVPRDFFKRGFDDAWSRMLAIGVRRLATAGEAAKALEVAERARARAFADLLAARAVERTPLLPVSPAALPPAPAGGAGSADTGASTAAARRELPVAMPMARGTRLESASRAESATLDRIVAIARAGATTILAYWVDRDATLAWRVSPSGDVRLHRLPIGAEALQRAVQATFTPAAPRRSSARRPAAAVAPVAVTTRGAAAFTMGAESRAAYRLLHDALIAPLRADLPAAGSPVTIVPHGPLFRLSFAALANKAGRYLLEDYRLSYAPSVTVIGLVAAGSDAPTGASALLVGDPALPMEMRQAGHLERLPGAAREVEAIRRSAGSDATTVLTGATASESAVRAAAPTARVIHLATHAVVDDARPFDSFLAFAADAPPQDGDGRMTAEEVYDLDLDADLVVMSACRTATGPISGDGLLGLTRAFFAAGARSVVATLWDLPDAAAATMLPRFYREWQATGSRAEGLRRAQLAYLADLRAGKVVVTSPLGKTTLPEHPALWASLVLQGRP